MFLLQTNFFEKKVAEYAKNGVARKDTAQGEEGDGIQRNTHSFSLGEDF